MCFCKLHVLIRHQTAANIIREFSLNSDHVFLLLDGDYTRLKRATWSNMVYYKKHDVVEACRSIAEGKDAKKAERLLKKYEWKGWKKSNGLSHKQGIQVKAAHKWIIPLYISKAI
jgi:hypothetical protein